MEISKSTIKDKFSHLSRKFTTDKTLFPTTMKFLNKHVRCAQPNWKRKKKMKMMTNSNSNSVEMMMMEENLEDDCGGDGYNAKCQGFGQKLAEQVHDELNKNS